MPKIDIKHKDGHYELSIDGKFHSSHDTVMEAVKEAEEETQNEDSL